MTARWLLPLVLLSATALLPSAANAQPLLHDAVAVVADPVTLDREVQAGAIPFQVHVVYLNARNLMPTIGALQFGLEVDPGLTVIGHSTAGCSSSLHRSSTRSYCRIALACSARVSQWP